MHHYHHRSIMPIEMPSHRRPRSYELKASILVEIPVTRKRSLRRMLSPTECSLRELAEKHAEQEVAAKALRQKQSDYALQRACEASILAYLQADVAALDEVEEESEDEEYAE